MIALLRRKVENIVVFINTETKLSLEYSHADTFPQSLVMKVPLDMDTVIKVNMYPYKLNELKWYTDLSVTCPVKIPVCY